MFIDKVKIFIKAGNGGNGCTSFYTEKYVANGGPDGGDGGKGGDIVFCVDAHKNSLSDFRFSQHFRAPDGENGAPKYCHGRQGEPLVIKVPQGTVIRDEESGRIVADMFDETQTVTVLSGGMGGKGNARFKSSRRQAPHFSQRGQATEEHAVILELMTIADVGLVGYPNVGKSTLLSVISNARPKIANYHFTTLSPNLGVVSYYDRSFVVADIPGLIEGASEGVGLGHDFLRHIDRTRLLVHVIDVSGHEGRDPYDDYKKINSELKSYNDRISHLPQIIALNKCDIAPEENIKEFRRRVRGKRIVEISGITHKGVDELVREIAKKLDELPPLEPIEYEPFEFGKADTTGYRIDRFDDGSFGLSGGFIDEIARGVVLDDYDSFNYFQKTLKEKGIIKELKNRGAKDGDIIRILDFEFEYVE